MYIDLREHGKMWPDYFQGTSGVQINVYADGLTILEVIEAIKSEINDLWEHIEFVAKSHGFPVEELEKSINDVIEKIYADTEAVNSQKLMYLTEAELTEDLDEDGEIAPCIFSLEFIND